MEHGSWAGLCFNLESDSPNAKVEEEGAQNSRARMDAS